MSAYDINPQELADEVEHNRMALRRSADAAPASPLRSAAVGAGLGAGIGGLAGAAAMLPAVSGHGRAGALKAVLAGSGVFGAGTGLLGGLIGHGSATAHNEGIDRSKALLNSDPEVLERVLRHRARNSIRDRMYDYDYGIAAAGAPSVTTNVFRETDPYLD